MARDYGFMDFGLSVFDFYVLGYLFRFSWWAYEELLAMDGKTVHFIPPFLSIKLHIFVLANISISLT